MELSKVYNPKEVENRIYDLWQKSGFFNPDKLPDKRKKPFTIIMPPPNANGSLHIGHAVFVALQDIMIRYQRMRGRKTLWLPGADHAGFETQVVFDKKLEKEGRSRFQIPRDQLYQEMLQFTLENKKIMEEQLRKLGASCDWSREKFTLDKDIVRKTQETFVRLYKDRLVYRGERIVNWCVKHQTALADLETKYIEEKTPLYYLKYGPFTIATARPETKFGDKYVVMHPKDKRYAKYKNGDTLQTEWIQGQVKASIVKDESIDMSFGTGVMTITPWHDPIDFEIAERHKLDRQQIIDQQGKLLPVAQEFAGMKIQEARPKICDKLKSKSLLVKVDENYTHKISVCYKCANPIEPQILPQWFLKIKPLAKKAIEIVEQGKIAFVPGRFKKVYFHWLKNIRDWNLSQQITWGIRIPAWFRKNEVYVGLAKPTGEDWTQDPDVLTTWFSSGQWPFLTLGYPNSKDYKTFYPTDVMETGWDILFFWVARMIMLGLYCTKKVPFRTIYLHGLVRDKDRQKMSKSKGNVIDPLGVAELYGTDAVRMALIIGNTPGNDIVISEEKIRGYRNFANKIWNVGRFVMMNKGKANIKQKPKLSEKDAKHLSELNKLIANVTRAMDEFKFYIAAEKLYHYFWHSFADKIIEEKKKDFKSNNPTIKSSAEWLLLEIYATCLQLLHPFMPFITEEIYTNLLPAWPGKKPLLVEHWPN